MDDKDLTDNMFEWLLDWDGEERYSGQGNACIDCAYLGNGSLRALRGGSFSSFANGLLAAKRGNNGDRADPNDDFGIRCARNR